MQKKNQYHHFHLVLQMPHKLYPQIQRMQYSGN